ncbi:hypothetical protein AVEN_49309-1, partial [Araneus ventricosus]
NRRSSCNIASRSQLHLPIQCTCKQIFEPIGGNTILRAFVGETIHRFLACCHSERKLSISLLQPLTLFIRVQNSGWTVAHISESRIQQDVDQMDLTSLFLSALTARDKFLKIPFFPIRVKTRSLVSDKAASFWVRCGRSTTCSYPQI